MLTNIICLSKIHSNQNINYLSTKEKKKLEDYSTKKSANSVWWHDSRYRRRLNFFLVARCSLLFARCSLLFARCPLFFARCCSLLFACCSLIFCPSYVMKVCYKLKRNTIENVLISVFVASAKIPERDGSISRSSFYRQLLNYRHTC